MKTPLRTLIVEDSPADAELIIRELRRANFEPEITRVETEAEYLAELKKGSLDIILSDYRLPQFSGLRAVQLLRAQGSDLPFIIISGTIGEETAVEALNKGADDYLLKDRLARLGPAVTQATNESRLRRERRESEIETRRSEARFRAFFEQTAVAMSLVTHDFKFVRVNQRLCQLTGYAPEELLAMNCIELTHPEDRARTQEVIEQITTGGMHSQRLEQRYVRKDGSVVWCEVTITDLPAIDGHPAQFAKVVEDITERRTAVARLRRLVESNVQGVFFWEDSGRITSANQAFLEMIGCEREAQETGRLDVTELTPPEFKTRDQAAKEHLAATGVCAPYEKQFYRKDGSTVAVLVASATFEDNSAEGLTVAVDLSERKKLEEQFLRAQRMESIGTLAGGIAHDLNNVLGPIMMSIEVLKMRFPDSQSAELLEIISTSAERGSDMVRQVLSFARGVEGRRMELQVGHLLAEIERIAVDTFPKDIQVRTVVPHDLWTVHGDPTQLHQVLLNLCVNARDAMPSGGVLTIAAENRHIDEQYAALDPGASAGPHVCVKVEDTGTGMAKEIVEKIFDPFFTTKEVGKGTGLGLSTSMGIVKGHYGFLRVYSEPGRGTRFNLYLPAQTESSAEPESENEVGMPRGRGELVLVVDDEASVLQITKQTLEAFGYRVLIATNGGEAATVFAAQKSEIAVVLTDMMMPIMDGPATIQVLRKIKADVRVIAASGLAADGHVTEAERLGVKHFLPKPYTAGTLLNALRAILDEG